MRFIVRIPTKDTDVTLEATAKAPNWRDALKRVLRETGGDEHLLDRAHIHIRRDGRIVVEDPDTLRVYELRSEAEPGSKPARGPQELAVPTKKISPKTVKRPVKKPASEVPAIDDNKTAIGAPVLVQDADGQFSVAGNRPSSDTRSDAEKKPRKPGPADTAPKIAETLPASLPLHGPSQAGFQPVLRDKVASGDGSKEGSSNVVLAKKVADSEGAQKELPSVIVNLPEEQENLGAKAEIEQEGSDFEIKSKSSPQELAALDKRTDEREHPKALLPDPELPESPQVPESSIAEDSQALRAGSLQGHADKHQSRKDDAVRQSVPTLKAPDDFEDIRSGRSLEVVAGTFLRAIRARVSADLGIVLVPDARSKYVLLSAGYGLPKNFKARRFKYGDGVGGFACEYESSIQLDDPSTRPELIGKFEEMFPGAVSIVAFPVRYGKTTFGAIELVRTSGSPFNPEEYALLEALCEAQASKIS